jgi:hypothetical protein
MLEGAAMIGLPLGATIVIPGIVILILIIIAVLWFIF